MIASVPSPCRACHGACVVAFRPEKFTPWSAKCANAGLPGHRGNNGQNVGMTRDGTVEAWNRRQLIRGAYCKSHDFETAPDTRTFCHRCGLSEPHECLHGEHLSRLGDSDVHLGVRRW